MTFLRDSLRLSAVLIEGNDMIFWIFPMVPCHAFCMWHWPIGKGLDFSFIWGHHHLHLVSIWISVDQLNTSYSLLHRADETQQGRNSCPRLQFGFQFGLYRVVAPLSFLRSISLASLFAILSIFGWSDLLQILLKQAAFSFALLYTIMFNIQRRPLKLGT